MPLQETSVYETADNFLGIIVDDNLKFDKLINQICWKLPQISSTDHIYLGNNFVLFS